ncbi:MAG: protein kinase domain-containing protein [Actinomycetota bacterium]
MARQTVVLADRYGLGSVIGRGGMARVHKSADRLLGRTVAVKILASPYDRDERFVARFRREARAAARLAHPNIVAVFDTGSDGHTHYIVMEYVEGRTLHDAILLEAPMAPRRVAEIADAMAAALAAAHEAGIVHRDVKPANVMLTPEGEVKMMDFGLARAVDAETLTRTGFILGTASYVSPEQAQGGSTDARSDLYSLGCVLYEMLAGRPPFVGDSPVAVLYQHVNEPALPPSMFHPVPTGLEAVVLRCLAKNPDDRFQSALELRRELSPDGEGAAAEATTIPVMVDGAGVRHPQPTEVLDEPGGEAETLTSRRRWRGAAVVAGLAILVLLLVPAVQLLTRGAEPTGRGTATSPAASPSAPPTVEPSPTVSEAYSFLVATIFDAQQGGPITEGAAEDLLNRAEEIRKAYVEGDTEDLAGKIEEFADKLKEFVQKHEITPSRAGAIVEALDDLVQAMEERPPSGDED